MEKKILEYIIIFRSEDDDKIEKAKEELLNLATAIGKNTLYDYLESAKKTELLPVQWEIEDVMDCLVPPKEDITDEEDDPSKRELRQSELDLVAQTPQGIFLYKSKVDTRWVVMQINPYTGQLMGRKEVPNEEGEKIFVQLKGQEQGQY